MKALILFAIRAYQRHCASRWNYSVCCKRVTCSRFAIKSIERYGIIKGLEIAATRLRTCR